MTAVDTAILRKYLGWCPNAPVIRPVRQGMDGGEGGAGLDGGTPRPGGITGWIGRNGQAAVAVTTGLCLIALAVVLKNIILVPPDTLNRDMVLYIIIYCGYFASFTPFRKQACPAMPERWPLFWCAMSVLITLAIIAVYAW